MGNVLCTISNATKFKKNSGSNFDGLVYGWNEIFNRRTLLASPLKS